MSVQELVARLRSGENTPELRRDILLDMAKDHTCKQLVRALKSDRMLFYVQYYTPDFLLSVQNAINFLTGGRVAIQDTEGELSFVTSLICNNPGMFTLEGVTAKEIMALWMEGCVRFTSFQDNGK